MIGSISHDFRTPLNGLMTTLQSIEEGEVSKFFYKTYIVPCLESSDFLLSLSDDMLVYTQISLNKEFRMYYEPIDLKKIINTIVKLMKSKALSRKIKLIAQCPENLYKSFCTEPRRIK